MKENDEREEDIASDEDQKTLNEKCTEREWGECENLYYFIVIYT